MAATVHLHDEGPAQGRPPKREVLKDIWLSFYPGRQDRRPRRATAPARARCCGSWPASTRSSSARPSPPTASRIGYLPQEPQLDATKDVLGNVEEAVAADAATLLDALRGDQRRSSASPTPTRWTSCSTSRPSCRTRSTPPTRWELDRTLEIAMDALRLPAGRRRRRQRSPAASSAASRCAGCCSQKPDLLLLDEPTNHLDAESRRLARAASCTSIPGTVVAVTHDRYFLDNVAGWILELDRGAGHPVEGQLLVAGSSRSRSGSPTRRSRSRRASARSRASSSGCAMSPKARQAKSKARLAAPTRSCSRRSERQARDDDRDRRSRPGRASATSWSRPRSCSKGFGDNLLIEDLDFRLPARRHRRRHRPQRRRQDDAVPHDHRPGEARRGRRSRSARR